jgi:hypothetical protein
MSQITGELSHTAVAGPADSQAPTRRTLAPLRWVGLFAAAWLVPLLTHAVGVDWLLPILLLLGLASLLRAGHALFDRLMFAAILLCGAAVAGGVLFSLWPWGLHPVPVGGTGLTCLALFALVTRRRPQLPTRVLGSDLIILGLAALSAALLYRPLASRSFAARLPIIASAEDRTAHFDLFDTIQRIGGYPFIRPGEARVYVVPPTESVYPQGSHYLYALLNVFARSNTDPGPAVASFNYYFLFLIAGYAFLVVAVAWAARWVAGPALAGWRRALICATVGTVAAIGSLAALVGAGFDSEILGLAFLAVTMAVVVRPAGGVRQHVLIVGSALIALAYTYNLFVVLAGIMVLAAAVVYRARLLQHRLFVAVAAVLTAGIALLPTIVAEFSGFNTGSQIKLGGYAIPLARSPIAGLVLITLAVMVTRAGRRSPVWRVVVAQMVVCSAVVGAFGVYLHFTTGTAGYYFEKALAGIFVMGLVGFGACGYFFRPTRWQPSTTRVSRWRTDLAPGVAAMLIAGTVLGGVQWGLPNQNGRSELAQSFIGTWSSGHVASSTGKLAQRLDAAGLMEDGVPSLIFYTNSGIGNWRLSYLNAVLSHHAGQLGKTDYAILKADAVVKDDKAAKDDKAVADKAVVDDKTPADKRVITDADLREGVGIVEGAIRMSPVPLRVITSDAWFADQMWAFGAANPQLGLTVLLRPDLF